MVWQSPGFFCSAMGTNVPQLVVYSDGAVLQSDGIGAHCEPLPTITAGWIDPQLLAEWLSAYFASPESSANLDLMNVTDLGSAGAGLRPTRPAPITRCPPTGCGSTTRPSTPPASWRMPARCCGP